MSWGQLPSTQWICEQITCKNHGPAEGYWKAIVCRISRSWSSHWMRFWDSQFCSKSWPDNRCSNAWVLSDGFPAHKEAWTWKHGVTTPPTGIFEGHWHGSLLWLPFTITWEIARWFWGKTIAVAEWKKDPLLEIDSIGHTKHRKHRLDFCCSNFSCLCRG